MRLIDFFDRGYNHYPNNPCLIQNDKTLSFREVWRASHSIANRLRAQNLEDDAVIAVLSSNHLLTMVAILGILRSGYIWMPLNTRNEGPEIENTLNTHKAQFLFHDQASTALVKDLLQYLPDISGTASIDGTATDSHSLQHWIDNGDQTPFNRVQSPDAVFAIRSTGGTTGPSKGVLVTNRVYSTVFANYLSILPMPVNPVHLVAAPLSHAAGVLCFPAMAFGGSNVILSKADPEVILASIEKHRVTHLFLPPTLIYMLLDSPNLSKHDYSSLDHLIYSAAPMSVARLKEAIAAFGPVLAQAYGQAEAPFFCTILKPEEHVTEPDKQEQRLTSCGRATPFTQLAVMNDDGQLLEPNEVGEIVVRGDIVMKGYNHNPEATAEVSRFGWHHTGDMGYRDEQGYYYLVDRKRDLIISGGFNIYPGEIEQVLWSHNAVADCAVVGVPDSKWGEAIKAVIQLKPGQQATAEELIALCQDKLGKMKAPKSVEFWENLPRSPVGKVLKKSIRSTFWAANERKI